MTAGKIEAKKNIKIECDNEDYKFAKMEIFDLKKSVREMDSFKQSIFYKLYKFFNRNPI